MQWLRTRGLVRTAGATTIALFGAATLCAARAGVLAPWLAAAASLLLTAALGGYALDLRARVGTLETRLRDALARADAGGFSASP